MHLTPREMDKLLVLSLGDVARRRKERGLKLNHPEAVAFITSTALEEARSGKTVEEVMNMAGKALTRADVMEGVPEMIPFVQLEAVFTGDNRAFDIGFGKEGGNELKETFLHGGPRKGRFAFNLY